MLGAIIAILFIVFLLGLFTAVSTAVKKVLDE